MMCSLKDMALSIGNPKIHCFIIANLGVTSYFQTLIWCSIAMFDIPSREKAWRSMEPGGMRTLGPFCSGWCRKIWWWMLCSGWMRISHLRVCPSDREKRTLEKNPGSYGRRCWEKGETCTLKVLMLLFGPERFFFLLWWSVVQSFWHVLNIWLCTVYWLFAYYFHNAMINYTYCVSRLVRSFYIMHHLCMWCSLI